MHRVNVCSWADIWLKPHMGQYVGSPPYQVSTVVGGKLLSSYNFVNLFGMYTTLAFYLYMVKCISILTKVELEYCYLINIFYLLLGENDILIL